MKVEEHYNKSEAAGVDVEVEGVAGDAAVGVEAGAMKEEEGVNYSVGVASVNGLKRNLNAVWEHEGEVLVGGDPGNENGGVMMGVVNVEDVNGMSDGYHRHVEVEVEAGGGLLSAEDDVEVGVVGGADSYTHSCSCSGVGDDTCICRQKTSRRRGGG